MPIGSGLAHTIEAIMNQEHNGRNYDGPVCQALMRGGGLGDDEIKAIKRVRQGIVTKESIDDFIDEWQDIPKLAEVAKLGITHALLQAERHTHWGKAATKEITYSDALRASRDTWLGQVLRMHNRRSSRRHFVDTMSDVAFVIFNYDRLIEFYLYNHLTIALAVPKDEAREILHSLPLIHVYGPIGVLPELGGHQPFGASEPQTLMHSARMIRTYTEAVESVTGEMIARMIANAERVVFLGAAYHDQNLNLLFPDRSFLDSPSGPSIFGTTFGMRASRIAAVDQIFRNPYKPSYFRSLEAGPFIDHFQDDLFA